MAYDNSHVWVVYNVLTAPQMQQQSDNIGYLYTEVTTNIPAKASGVTCFFPPEILYVYNTAQTAITANRVYLSRISWPHQRKVKGFAGVFTGVNTRWGAGIYTLDGTTLLCSGVTGSIGAGTIVVNCAANTIIYPGVYWLAMTGDAASALNGAFGWGAPIIGAINTTDVIHGYTATVSAAGVLPASVALPPTAINVAGGPNVSWAIMTTTI